MKNLKYPENVFPLEIHKEIQLFYSESLGYCYGIYKSELEKFKNVQKIGFLSQLEGDYKIKLYKLQVWYPYITDVAEYFSMNDLVFIDEKWHRIKVK